MPESQNSSSPSPTCIICLDTISDRAIAQPCGHDCFDFPCLGSWLVSKGTCPICKSDVKKLVYEVEGEGESKVFDLAEAVQTAGSASHRNSGDNGLATTGTHQRRQQRRPPGRFPSENVRNDAQTRHDIALERRRRVYRHQLLSLHVGTNRVSKYRDFSARQFSGDDQLISKARKWIRRELQVFRFLDPCAAKTGEDHEQGSPRRSGPRRACSDAEFVLEYVVAMLKVIDIRASEGQAEELLKDFLGRANARIFLHELHTWLRSPFTHLRDWDGAVQYPHRGARSMEPTADAG